MSAETNSIQKLAQDGMSADDIAVGMNLSVPYVKAVLGRGAELTEDDQTELKEIIFDIARGRAMNGTVESQLAAAVYLHKTRVEETRLKGSWKGAADMMDMLRQKAAERMKHIEDATSITV